MAFPQQRLAELAQRQRLYGLGERIGFVAGVDDYLAFRLEVCTSVMEQSGKAVDFVEDDELVFVAAKLKFRLGKFRSIGVGFQIEIYRWPMDAHFMRQRGLADLARPLHGDGWHGVEEFGELSGFAALNHPCMYGISFRKYENKADFFNLGAKP